MSGRRPARCNAAASAPWGKLGEKYETPQKQQKAQSSEGKWNYSNAESRHTGELKHFVLEPDSTQPGLLNYLLFASPVMGQRNGGRRQPGRNCFNYQAHVGATLDPAWCPRSTGAGATEWSVLR